MFLARSIAQSLLCHLFGLGPGPEPYIAVPVQDARTQLKDCPEMIDSPRDIDTAPEREAATILGASDQEVRQYVRHGIMERRLSGVVRRLNWLEIQPPTRDLARRALRQLGFPTAQ